MFSVICLNSTDKEYFQCEDKKEALKIYNKNVNNYKAIILTDDNEVLLSEGDKDLLTFYITVILEKTFNEKDENYDDTPAGTFANESGLSLSGEAMYENINTGLHYGHLKKAETFGRQTGGRSTGHFGTGVYFFKDENSKGAKDYNKSEGQKGHGIYKVDFTDYNLFKPKSNDDAFNLHSALGYINNKDVSISVYNKYKDNTSELINDYRNIIDENILNTLDFDKNSILKTLEKIFILEKETKQDIDPYNKQIFLEMQEDLQNDNFEKEDLYDYVGEITKFFNNSINELETNVEITEKVIKDLEEIFNIGKNQLIHKLTKVEEYLQSNPSKESDSLSTYLMKDLGYEGIDVRHLNLLDNSAYGSVIYDLKDSSILKEDFRNLMQQNMFDKMSPEYSSDIQFLIDDAESQGIELKDYIDTDYNLTQVSEVLLGLENNLDVSKYNDKNLNFKQMEVIRKFLQKGIDITFLNVKQYNPSELNQIGLAIKDGATEDWVKTNMANKSGMWDMQKIRLELKSTLKENINEANLEEIVKEAFINSNINSDSNGNYTIDLYANQDDLIPVDEINKMLEAETPVEVLNEFIHESYIDEVLEMESEVFNLVESYIQENYPEIEDEDNKINDLISERITVNYPYEHYLNQTYMAIITLGTKKDIQTKYKGIPDVSQLSDTNLYQSGTIFDMFLQSRDLNVVDLNTRWQHLNINSDYDEANYKPSPNKTLETILNNLRLQFDNPQLCNIPTFVCDLNLKDLIKLKESKNLELDIRGSFGLSDSVEELPNEFEVIPNIDAEISSNFINTIHVITYKDLYQVTGGDSIISKVKVIGE